MPRSRRRASAVMGRLPSSGSTDATALTSSLEVNDLFRDEDIIQKVEEEEELVRDQRKVIKKLEGFVQEAETNMEEMERMYLQIKEDLENKVLLFQEAIGDSSAKLKTLKKVSAKMDKQVSKLASIYRQDFQNSKLVDGYSAQVEYFMTRLHKKHRSRLAELGNVIAEAELTIYAAPSSHVSLKSSLKNENVIIMSSETSLTLLIFFCLWTTYFVYTSGDIIMHD